MYPYEKISIIVISHNEERNIGECLESLLSLDYPKDLYEIIVVDSSNDGTRDIVRKYGAVKLVPSNCKGFSAKRNAGVREATSELIAFIDADCNAPPQWLKRIQTKIRDRKVGAVGSDAFPPKNSPFAGRLIACIGKPAGGAIGFDSSFKRLARGINVVVTCNSLFKKSVLLRVGGFDEQTDFWAGGEDCDISNRIIAAGYVLEYQPGAYVYHKTRNLREFFKWSYRDGMAEHLHFRKEDHFIKGLLSPFSFVWLIIFLLSPIISPLWVVMMFSATLIIFASALLIFAGNLFPTGRKKLRLLVERRKRIGVSLISILLLVIPLLYINRLIINFGQLYSILRQNR